MDGWDKGFIGGGGDKGFSGEGGGIRSYKGGGGGTRVARTAKNLVALGAVGSVLIRRGGSGRRRGE